MKKIYVLLLALMCAHAAIAQDNNPPAEDSSPIAVENGNKRFGLNVLVGFNAAQLDGDGMDGYNALGLNAGLRANIRISPLITTSVGMQYTQLGAKANTRYISAFRTINLDYVQVPLMVHFNEWRFRFGTGFSYSRLFNARFVEFTSGNEVESYRSVPRNYDVAWHIEGTYFFTPKWGLNLQYSRSLMNIDSRSVVFADIRYVSPYLYAHYLTARALYSF